MDITEILAGSGGVLVLLLSFVKIPKLELNLWSFLARSFGRAINGEIMSKIMEISNDVNELKCKQDEETQKTEERDADQCRARILRFADELRRDIEHSEEFFNQILDDITRYEHYCDTHPEYKNNKATNAIARIDAVYQHCQAENTFL